MPFPPTPFGTLRHPGGTGRHCNPHEISLDTFGGEALTARLHILISAYVLASQALAQKFEQRGFLENQTLVFPQTTSTDRAHIVDNALLRWEVSYKLTPWLSVNTAIDARADTHRQAERSFHWTLDDRTTQRPSFALRRVSATAHKGGLTFEAGRQFIRWGKTDIVNPTDRFAPKDYLASVIDSDFLGVWATRATYENKGNTIDLVWQPRFTPSRIPLFGQRWAPLPAEAQQVRLVDEGARYPGRSQFGARWNHIGSGYEYSLSYFDGFQNLPSLDPRLLSPTSAAVTRFFPSLRMYGADAAVPLRWLTVKGEAAYFGSSTAGMDKYVLYVLQLERQWKEWSFVGGYAGDVSVTNLGNPLRFGVDRGFAKSFVGHAGLTIDANRNLNVDAVIRGGGSFVRFEYSQLFGPHWRATGGVAWIRGDLADFLGQYRRNSYGSLALRYSF
jgi:hypothetical protein